MRSFRCAASSRRGTLTRLRRSQGNMSTGNSTELNSDREGEFYPEPNSKDYERWLKRRCITGNWFVCFDDFLEVMSIEAAWILQRIINLGKRTPKTKLERRLHTDGWIRVSVDFLMKKTRMSRK